MKSGARNYRMLSLKLERMRKVIKSLKVYSHEGYVKSDDSKFDIVREYGKKVKTQ